VGFGAACRGAVACLETDAQAAAESRAAFLSALAARGVCFSLNSPVQALPHILNLRIHGVDAADMMLALAGDIAFSTGSACRSGKPSAVLAAMGLGAAESAQSLRLCFGRSIDKAAARQAAERIATYVAGAEGVPVAAGIG